jgi:urease
MSIGATMLGRRHVLPSVCSTLTEIMVEGTFPTGTYLVTVHHPISSDDGDLAKALYGSFLPIPEKYSFPLPDEEAYEPTAQPGAVVTVKGKVVLNEGRKRIKLKVTSKGDRPIQVSLKYDWQYEADGFRLALITILSRQIPNSNSIESRPTAID